MSPDPFLYDYMNEYALLADIYQTVSFNLDPKTGRRRFEYQFLQKTDRLIREHVTAYAVAAPLPLYPINRNLADVIAQDQISERVKVINLQRSLTAYIEQNLEHAPYLATLGAEVEKVIEQLRLKQISAQTALTQLEAHAGHAVTLDEERHASDLTDLAFALRTGLRAAPSLHSLDPGPLDALTNQIAAYLQANRGWPHNQRLESQVQLELYRLLMPHMAKPIQPANVSAIVTDLLRMHRITL